jgi:DNA-binding NarL/FixJ family response regulator
MTVEASAQQLGVCLSTLRSHVRNLLGKTQASSLMQLLRWVGSGQALPH